MKKIAILGSTGFIGRKALELVQEHPKLFRIVGLSAYSNYQLLAQQAEQFYPAKVAIGNENYYFHLKEMLKSKNIDVLKGMDGICEVAGMDADLIVLAISGTAAFLPLLKAINAGKKIALASKEALVAGGEFIMKKVKEKNIKIIPIDSEHNALFQLLSDKKEAIERIILTCSGGPLNGIETNNLQDITPEQALAHPRWEMGRKITVDSATLMNKGFEVIEAHWLFDIEIDKIDVLIHPEAIIHAIVKYVDGSYQAVLAPADMKIPLAYALGYPQRLKIKNKLNWQELNLTFKMPDYDKFPCLELGYKAIMMGESFPAVLSGADEVCVEAFLKGEIKISDIPIILKKVLNEHQPLKLNRAETVLKVVQSAQCEARRIIERGEF